MAGRPFFSYKKSRKELFGTRSHPQNHRLGTVDGSEIRRAPVEVGRLSTTICKVSAPSQVIVWDF